MAGRSTTSRSVAYLRSHGCITDVVERYEAGAKHDMFELFDIAAVSMHAGVMLFVQTTTKPNMAKRIKKIESSAITREILKTGSRVIVHGWAQDGLDGGWRPHMCEFRLGSGDDSRIYKCQEPLA